MSTTDIPRRTHSSNATKRPGQIVLDAQIQRRSKVQKERDDLAIKEAKEAKDTAVQNGLERMAGMQVEMEAAQAAALTKTVIPVRPKPRARKAKKVIKADSDPLETVDNHADSIQEEVPDVNVTNSSQQTGPDNGTGARAKKAGKKAGKMLTKDAIDKEQKKISASKGEGDSTDKARADGKDTV
jgi:hypothetical protein